MSMRGKGVKIYFDLDWDGVAAPAFVDEHCYLVNVKPSGIVRSTSPVTQCLSQQEGFNETDEAVWQDVTGVVLLDLSSGGNQLQDKLIAACQTDKRVAWSIEFPEAAGVYYQEGTGKVASYNPQEISKNDEIQADIVLTCDTVPTIKDTINIAP